jgi:hypothetical protein
VRAEVRAEHWLAIGEGATGIFWFIYSSQQGWRGLVDNAPLYTEVTALAHRIGPLLNLLLRLHKSANVFAITDEKDSYVSTLASSDGAKFYAVAVNRDCERSQMLAISSPVVSGQLKDVESNEIYGMGQPIAFPPSEGRIFELVEFGDNSPTH